MTVAVIGLGDLGLACGLRLHELGLEPIGVDTSEGRRTAWQQATGRDAAAGLAGLSLDHALICVRTSSQASDVLAGLPGCAAGRGLAAYVLTTLDPAFARGLARSAAGELRVIELPVSGGRAAARRGELTVLVGGDQATAVDVAFIERTLASRTFAFPRFGDATLAKLLNNTVATYNSMAFATCLALADKAGLAADVCAQIIRVSSGGSWVAEHYAALIDDLLAKDTALLAAELGQLPVIQLSDHDHLLATLGHGRALLAGSDD